MGSILVGDSDFFVQRSCHVDHFTFHISLPSLKLSNFIYLSSYSVVRLFCFAASSDWLLKYLLVQSNNKTKPIDTCPPAFSRAWRGLRIFEFSLAHCVAYVTYNYFGLVNKTQGKTTSLTYLKNVCFHGKYNSKPAGLWTAKIHPRKYEHAISHHAFKQLHFFVKCTRRDKLKESEDNATVTNNFDTRNQSAETCCFINQSALRSAFLFSRAYLAPVTRHVFPRLRLVARFGCDF